MRQGRDHFDQPVEADVPYVPAVPAEDELVEMGLEVRAAEAMENARAPSLHQREHPVDPGQRNVRWHLPDDPAVVLVLALERAISLQAVADERRPGGHIGADKATDAL